MGDVRGAVNLVTSRESVLPPSEDAKLKLQSKHPQRNSHGEPTPVPLPDQNYNLNHFKVSKVDVKWAIGAFKKGASGGPDGLRPQHLLDMTGQALGESAENLVESLVDLLNLIILPGKVPTKIQPTGYGANLMALKKPDGGVHPIAVGLTLRRLAAKIIMSKLRTFCAEKFRPHQMGVGTPKGCEASVHAVQAYVENDAVQDQVLLKIDFRNAFNSVRRDKVLQLVHDNIPEIYSFIYQCYEEDSNLFFGENMINSSEGVQQGDPMGPFLFSLATMDISKNMNSDLNIWYLDDGTITGDVKTVLSDYNKILKALISHGLEVNPSKCELFLINPQSEECFNALTSFREVTDGIKLVEKKDLTLLGAPIFPEAIDDVLEAKLENLKLMSQRLKQIDNHQALFLLRNCFGMP